MTPFVNVLCRLAGCAVLLFAGVACTSPTGPVDRGEFVGAWSGWQDIDEGGFEQMGQISWLPEGEAQYYAGSAKSVSSVYGTVVARHQVDIYTSGVVNYAFYPARSWLRDLRAPKTYIRLSAHGHLANKIVLDQAAASGGMVHVSGRQRSGLRPLAGYVEVTRVTPVNRKKQGFFE